MLITNLFDLSAFDGPRLPLSVDRSGTRTDRVGTHANSGSGRDREPMIIAFCCNWCAYAGADLAGASRAQYPPNCEDNQGDVLWTGGPRVGPQML